MPIYRWGSVLWFWVTSLTVFVGWSFCYEDMLALFLICAWSGFASWSECSTKSRSQAWNVLTDDVLLDSDVNGVKLVRVLYEVAKPSLEHIEWWCTAQFRHQWKAGVSATEVTIQHRQLKRRREAKPGTFWVMMYRSIQTPTKSSWREDVEVCLLKVDNG